SARVEEPISLLTRVTRIFTKSVFTKTTRDARAGCRAGLFVARARVRPRRARFSSLQKKQENTGDHTKGAAASRRPPFGCCMSALLGDRAHDARGRAGIAGGAPGLTHDLEHLPVIRGDRRHRGLGFIKTTL